MAFSKFDPHRPEEEGHDAANESAARRAKVLKYGWWITTAYTALGFVFIAYWLLT